MKSSISTHVKFAALIITSALVFSAVLPWLHTSDRTALDILKETGYSNTTATIYLKSRMLDTVFEVLVFSLVIIGLSTHHKSKGRYHEDIKDDVFTNIAKIASFFLMIASLYLALTGHLFPGGGFTAGVTGGTAILLMAISSGFDKFESNFKRLKVDVLEKILISAIIISSLIEFRLPSQRFIILQNVLIYFKVMAGTWIVLYNLIKYRGIV